MDDDKRLAFRFDCGATWLNLLATRGRSASTHPVERLGTPERLWEWLNLSELTPERAPESADVERARDIRETLRALALCTVREEPPPGDAVEVLAKFLAGQPDPVRLVAGKRLLRQTPTSTVAALARIARQAVDHLTGPERRTLAVCDEQDCHGLFADPSGRRRWCPAPACASRGRVRALRARRRTEPVERP